MDEKEIGRAIRYFTTGFLVYLDSCPVDCVADILAKGFQNAIKILHPNNGKQEFNNIQNECRENIKNNFIEQLNRKLKS